ncbi:MAG: DNA/RNA non-specific endonuclease [Cyanobacteria bacterium P01_D01_bin.105]
MRYLAGYLAGAATILVAVGVSGCHRQLSEEERYAALPPCADRDCDCGDFVSQHIAQDVLTAFEEDYFGLDQDGNGQACERLPQADLSLDRETYFSNNEHLMLGNLSNAGPANSDNLLIEREQYALSYSQSLNRLNWASWWVDSRWLGYTGRQDDFRQDGSLPAGFYQVTSDEFRRSGYDRGHMVPSGDRTANARDNSLTFLMSNIFPQAQANNRGPWRELEEYGRRLVENQGKSLYVMGGVYGNKGKAGKVTIPGRTWKVIVVLDHINDEVTRRTDVIAVDMPNSDEIEDDWREYATTVDRIEIATGYDLLSDVPEEIQAIVESQKEDFGDSL